jgi:hypothetical protein
VTPCYGLRPATAGFLGGKLGANRVQVLVPLAEAIAKLTVGSLLRLQKIEGATTVRAEQVRRGARLRPKPYRTPGPPNGPVPFAIV